MIARTWRGATKAEDADAYLEYLHDTGLRGFRETPGNLGALALRQIADGRAVFLIVSFWESPDAIRAFAGEDIERAVFYPEDEHFLVDRDNHVTHFEVYESGRRAELGGRREWPTGRTIPRHFR